MARSIKIYGDKEGASRCLPEAERLLYLLKARNINNLDSVWDNRYLADGSFVKVSSIFGNDYISITSPIIEVKPTGAGFYLFLVFMDIYANPNTKYPKLDFWDALIVWEISDNGKLIPVSANTLKDVITPSNIDTLTSLLTVQSSPNANKHSIRLPNVWYYNGDPTAFRMHTYRDGIGGAMQMEMYGSPWEWKMYGDTRIVSSFDDPWAVQIGHPYPFHPTDFSENSSYINELTLPQYNVWDMNGLDMVRPVMQARGLASVGSGRKPFIITGNKMIKRFIGIYADLMWELEALLLVNGEDPLAYGIHDGIILIAWESENGIGTNTIETYKGVDVTNESNFGGWVDNAPGSYSYNDPVVYCAIYSGGCTGSGSITSCSPLPPVISGTSRDNFIDYYALFNDKTVRVEKSATTQVTGSNEPCAFAHRQDSIASSYERWGNTMGGPDKLCYIREQYNNTDTDETIHKVVTVTKNEDTQNVYVGDDLIMSLLSTQDKTIEENTQVVYTADGESICSDLISCASPACSIYYAPGPILPITYPKNRSLTSSETKDWGYPEGYYRHPVLKTEMHYSTNNITSFQDYDYEGDDFIILSTLNNFDYYYLYKSIWAPGVAIDGQDPWIKDESDIPDPRPHTYYRREIYTTTYRIHYKINGTLIECVLPCSFTKTDIFEYDWDESIKAIPEFTETNGKWVGESIIGFSCQIHKDYIGYTYIINKFDANEVGQFYKRIIGKINRKNGTKNEFTINETLPIYDKSMKYWDFAAIGIHQTTEVLD